MAFVTILKLALSPKTLTVYFLLALAIGIGGRWISLFYTQFWLDELWSALFSRPDLPLSEVIRLTLNDVHPPLYQILLYACYQLFGYSEFSSRLPSFVFGVLAIYGFYLLANALYQKTVAQFATIVFCCSIFAFAYCSEARSYELLLMASVFSSYYFFQWSVNKQPCYLHYIFFGIVAIYTHYFGVILLLSHGLMALLMVLNQRDKKLFIRCGIIFSLLACCYFPMLPFILNNLARPDFWIQQPHPLTLLFYPFFFLNLYAAPIIIAFLLYAGFSKKPRPQAIEAYLFVGAMSIIVIPYGIGFMTHPILDPRNAIIGLPYWLLLAIWLAAHLGRKSLQAFIIFNLACIIVTSVVLPRFKGQDLDQVLMQAQASHSPLYIINSAIDGAGTLKTIDFIKTKIALNPSRYQNLQLLSRDQQTPTQPRFWLACYHTCQRVDFKQWIPAHYSVQNRVSLRGVKALFLVQDKAIH